MPTHTLIQRTHPAKLGDLCDLCDMAPGAWIYRSRSETNRLVRDNGIVIDNWIESDWLICHVCAIHVEGRDNMRLLQRMNDGNSNLKLTRRNVRTIASFMTQLLPGRERRPNVE